MAMFEEIVMIGKEFRLPGMCYAMESISTGNINSTYKVTYHRPDGSVKSYIFQKINTIVFRNPEAIMENIDLVTKHVSDHFPAETTLHFYHTQERRNFLYDEEGNFWRVMNYVDSVSYDISDDPVIIAATGEAFGRFQMQLSDFDGALLHETIPDFHNTVKRLDTLFAHVDEVDPALCASCESEIAYIASVRDKASWLSEQYNSGAFPVRVTHNDTKCNNVLFDRITKRPIVVIDLDTVMPGIGIYDFGDAVRSICNTAEEDEPDLSRVHFDLTKFKAFCSGYLTAVQGTFTREETDNLVLAAFSITIELASRFLDDYLTGNTYFKTNYPEHNLVRTRCQLALARDIERKADEMEQVIREIL